MIHANIAICQSERLRYNRKECKEKNEKRESRGGRESKKEWRKDAIMKGKNKQSQDDEMKLVVGKKGRNVLS